MGQVGSARGVALLGGLLVARRESGTRSGLESLGRASRHLEGLTQAVKDSGGIAIAGLQHTGPANVALAASQAMIDASRVTTAAAALALIVGLLATFALPKTAAARDTSTLEN